MAVLKSWRFGIGFMLTLCVVGVVYFGYFYCGTGASCALGRGNSASTMFTSNYEAYLAGKYLQNNFPQNELNKNLNVDLDGQDVIVFLHIQKTGGTVFGKHLVENLEVDPPCHCYKRVKKHCDCLNKKQQVWLFSRYSTGWRCGLHADWTELTNCVNDFFEQTYGKMKRNYHYITMLRDPVRRFISEWMHVRRGATWKTASLRCNGRDATLQEVPFCYDTEDWTGVTLKEFMDCPHNLAFNRQTRMLANLTSVHCYNTSLMPPERRNALLLASAKQNLRRMSYFGLVEFQTFSQLLFEHTLHLHFHRDFVQHNVTHSSGTLDNIGPDDLRRIAELNHLDIELYQFAKDLFLQRVRQVYLDDKGLQPVPESLENLIAQRAASGGGGDGDEGDGGSGSGGQPMSDEDPLSPPASSPRLAALGDRMMMNKKSDDVSGKTFSRKKMFSKKNPQSPLQRKTDPLRKPKLLRDFGINGNPPFSRKRMFHKQNSQLNNAPFHEGGWQDQPRKEQGLVKEDNVIDSESRDSQHVQALDTGKSRLSRLIKERLLENS